MLHGFLLLGLEWNVPDVFDEDGAVRIMPDNPNLWSDGSFVWDRVSGASVAGSGMYAHVSGDAWRHRKWEHLDMVQPAHGNVVESCGGVPFGSWTPADSSLS